MPVMRKSLPHPGNGRFLLREKTSRRLFCLWSLLCRLPAEGGAAVAEELDGTYLPGSRFLNELSCKTEVINEYNCYHH